MDASRQRLYSILIFPQDANICMLFLMYLLTCVDFSYLLFCYDTSTYYTPSSIQIMFVMLPNKNINKNLKH